MQLASPSPETLNPESRDCGLGFRVWDHALNRTAKPTTTANHEYTKINLSSTEDKRRTNFNHHTFCCPKGLLNLVVVDNTRKLPWRPL